MVTSNIAALQKAVQSAPQDASALRALGNAYLEAGHFARAGDVLRAALDLEPDNVRALNNLGRSLYLNGDFAGARPIFLRTIALDPAYPVARLNLGLLLVATAECEEALSHLDACVALRPDLPQAWLTRSLALIELKRAQDALVGCDRAISLAPQLAEAHFIRGRALHELKRPQESLASCDQALVLQPGHKQVHYARGKLLRDLGDTQGAIASFAAALRVNPKNFDARWAAAMSLIPVLPHDVSESEASRPAFDRALTQLENDVRSAGPDAAAEMVGVMQPFFIAYQHQNNRGLLSRYGGICARVMGDWQRRRGLVRQSGMPHVKKRIGIVSDHIREHSVFAAITRGWLAQLDSTLFDISVFHLGHATDAHTDDARSRVPHFEQAGRPLAAWTEAILARHIDVLIYPELGMSQIALQLASMRLAPTQCVAWGHPETSGLPTMDYYLSAQAFEPPDGDSCYSEKLIRLPHLGSFYEPPDLNPATVQEPGDSEDRPHPHFICAGSPFKYAPQHDSVLVEIARRLGRCRFEFFTYGDGSLSRRLLKRLGSAFKAAGLSPTEFLRLSMRAEPAQFHALMRRADVMLDTIGFSGFNTVMQAVDCALPVVAHRGQFMRGRFGSGILERMEMSELVAADTEDYVQLAERLARDSTFALVAREKITDRRHLLYRDNSVISGLQDFLLHQA